MTLDKKQLDRLLRLNDRQLRDVLRQLLASYGVDPARIPWDTLDIGALRALLQNASDEDIDRFLQMFAGAGGAPDPSSGGATAGR